ncbi:MAG TPA: VOC family protein [Methylomirabilota bacterium]|nr:VOC family protein [Methylomirabilota bacterium]
MHLNTYIFFTGQCKEAFEFYAKVLGGKIEMMLPHAGSPAEQQVAPEWRDKILHARLLIGDNVLMASDAPPGRQSKTGGYAVNISLNDPAEGERIFRALEESGTVIMPYSETFWAVRYGMLADRFGITWMVNVEKPAERAASN